MASTATRVVLGRWTWISGRRS